MVCTNLGLQSSVREEAGVHPMPAESGFEQRKLELVPGHGPLQDGSEDDHGDSQRSVSNERPSPASLQP